ncbi:MAG: hypothetical protein ACREXW_14540 [Gammaproteobacteria bacterium]
MPSFKLALASCSVRFCCAVLTCRAANWALGDETILQEHVEQSLIVGRRRFGADRICRFGGALLSVDEGFTLGIRDDAILEEDLDQCFVGRRQWARDPSDVRMAAKSGVVIHL